MNRSENIRKWMAQAGCRRIRDTGVNNVISTCPFHGDRHPSFSMNTMNGTFLCYAAGCGVSGNLINFLMGALRWPYERASDAMRMCDIPDLDDESVYTLPPYERRRVRELEVETATMREGHLGIYRFCPHYMLERGYSKRQLKDWEYGFDYGSSRVTIPVRDAKGALLGITKRSTFEGQNPKYLHLGFRKANHLYGQHRVKGVDIAVVEGQVDVLAWYALQERHGFDPIECVSTMGSRVSDRQIRAMSRYKRVYLALDNDDDGRAATLRIGEGLIPRMRPGSVWVLRDFPSGCKDVGDVYEREVTAKDAERFRQHVEPYDLVRLRLLGLYSKR